MNDSPINELAKALSSAQGAFENPLKDGKNPHFNSRYATLDALQDATRKVLFDNGLCVTQLPQPGPEGWELHTMLIHSSGQSITSRLPLMAFAKGPQAAGSEITYMRRYAYASILNITAEEDDDANSAQSAAPERSGREYKLNPLNMMQPAAPMAGGPPDGEQKVARITGVRANTTGDSWFVDLQGFSDEGGGHTVWTKDESLAKALITEQGNMVNVHLRSKNPNKPRSHQLISYIPAGEQV